MKFAKFLETLTALLGRVSSVKSSLPDANSLDKDSVQAIQTRNLEQNAADLTKIGEEVKTMIGELQTAADAGVTAEEKAKLIDEAVAAGEILKKADHDAAVQVAVKNKEDELKQSFADQEATRQQVEVNRAKLGEKIKNAAALAAIPEAALTGDQVETNSAKIVDRFEKLSAKGITAEAALVEIASMALDEDGDAAYDGKLKLYEQLSGSKKPGQGGAPPAGGQEFGGNQGGETKATMLI